MAENQQKIKKSDQKTDYPCTICKKVDNNILTCYVSILLSITFYQSELIKCGLCK